MEINKDDFIKAVEISSMIGFKEGLEMCFKSIKQVLKKCPDANAEKIIEAVEKSFKKTLKESGTDVTYDDIKFLNNLLNV